MTLLTSKRVTLRSIHGLKVTRLLIELKVTSYIITTFGVNCNYGCNKYFPCSV